MKNTLQRRGQATGLIFFLNFGILPKFRTGEAIDISNLIHRSIVAITVQWMINSPKVVIVT